LEHPRLGLIPSNLAIPVHPGFDEYVTVLADGKKYILLPKELLRLRSASRIGWKTLENY